MKTIETKGGMIFEVIESLKEIKAYIMDGYIDNKEFLDDDFALYIRYKDGSEYYLCGATEDGRFKKTGIETVIESNPSSYIIYGKYRIYNIDDIDEEYRQETDDEEKFWNVDVA